MILAIVQAIVRGRLSRTKPLISASDFPCLSNFRCLGTSKKAVVNKITTPHAPAMSVAHAGIGSVRIKMKAIIPKQVIPIGASAIADALNSPICSEIYLEHQAESCLMMRWGDESPKTTLVCGMFTFNEFNQDTILSLLPPIIHFGAGACQLHGLNRFIEALLDEANANRQGKSILLHRLADILFIQIIRIWLADPANEAHGWLAGLRDPQIASTLSAIHANPAYDWTVEKLATTATMSRSAFSAKFTELIGIPPLAYSTRWRMQLATQLLRDGRLSLMQIAETIGYTSDIAFSKAFKREQGDSPAVYRRKYA